MRTRQRFMAPGGRVRRTSGGSYPPLFLRAGLVSLWRFEDSGNLGLDTMSAANNLTNNNTATQGTGKVGNCVTFAAASSQYLSIASNATLQAGAGDFWLSGWAKRTVNLTTAVLAGKRNTTATTAASMEYGVICFAGQIRFAASDGSAQTQVTSSSLAEDVWLHFFAWFSSGRVYLRTDNGAITSNTRATVQSSTFAFTVGARADGTAGFFDGSMDEVAFGKTAVGALGDGTNGTLANEISTTLHNGGAGLAWPW